MKKKEIGKLLELLNEYEKNNVVNWYERSDDEGVLTCRYIKENFLYYCEEASTIAISKYYGFIQWLVEGDKIDEKKVKKAAYYYWTDEYDVYEGDVFYHRLLMMLAVSNNPISDLISFLKTDD